MMRVYICPDCGWMRMVSRRKNVECYKCGVQDMTLAKVDFATYVSWSEKERQEYASAWMYIHNKGKIKRNKKKSKIKTEGVFLWQKLVLSEPEHGGQHLQCC